MVAAGAVAAIVLAGAAAADDRQDCATGGAELRLAACTRILQSAPADAIALGNRGVAYRVLGRFDAALADLNTALRIDPHNAGLYLERGLAFDAAGDHARAIADFSAAIARNATLIQAWFGRAMAYNASGQAALAAADLAKATQLNRTMVAALYMDRGYALHGRRQFPARSPLSTRRSNSARAGSQPIAGVARATKQPATPRRPSRTTRSASN